MSKFKIGDTVKVNNPKDIPSNSSYALSKSLLDKEGVIESVLTLSDRSIYSFADIHIDEECLELVKPAEENY